MASKQHGLTSMNATRPKSKLGKRKNKANARARKAVLLQALSEAVEAGRGKKAAKPAPKKATKAPKKTVAKKEVKEPKEKKEEAKAA